MVPLSFCPDHKHEFLNRDIWTKSLAERACCAATQQYDCRKPGLFKTEFASEGIVALSSKTYCCWKELDNAFKHHSKGLSKTTNSLYKETFLEVLNSKKSLAGTNKGFKLNKNQVFNYSQKRKALSWQYAKRHVFADGVSTKNIQI